MANRGDSGSSILASTLAGAVLGAAGLAWWLLTETERRQQRQRQQRGLRLSRLQGGVAEAPAPFHSGSSMPDSALQDKVQQLNQAIDDVRRQLESLSTNG
ncbi:MAG: hypothetical protein EBX49_08665 [Synechococcaceae bacterium WB8_1B_136]|nr:hypothetical protein [Synechococcaceae bacterium WB8_1B_136]